MYIKIHKDKHSEVVAVSDEEIIGKKFEDEKSSLFVSEGFYKGEQVNEEEARNLLVNAKNINAVGEESVKLCVKLGLIKEENILIIGGIKHAQIISA